MRRVILCGGKVAQEKPEQINMRPFKRFAVPPASDIYVSAYLYMSCSALLFGQHAVVFAGAFTFWQGLRDFSVR